jgi:hypothetical protein
MALVLNVSKLIGYILHCIVRLIRLLITWFVRKRELLILIVNTRYNKVLFNFWLLGGYFLFFESDICSKIQKKNRISQPTILLLGGRVCFPTRVTFILFTRNKNMIIWFFFNIENLFFSILPQTAGLYYWFFLDLWSNLYLSNLATQYLLRKKT